MAGWYAGCVAHRPGSDMLKLQRIGLHCRVRLQECGRAISGKAISTRFKTCHPFQRTETYLPGMSLRKKGAQSAWCCGRWGPLENISVWEASVQSFSWGTTLQLAGEGRNRELLGEGGRNRKRSAR